MNMSENIRFRSRFFAKDEIREKEDWMNEHFNKGYVVAHLEEIDSGYFVHLVHDPQFRMITRVRFFHRGMEEDMDRWVEQKVADGWGHEAHAVTEGYWVIIYREDEEAMPPVSRLILFQLVELWWLWFIGTVVFGFLYFTSG
jgi:hypothetical protein